MPLIGLSGCVGMGTFHPNINPIKLREEAIRYIDKEKFKELSPHERLLSALFGKNWK